MWKKNLALLKRIFCGLPVCLVLVCICISMQVIAADSNQDTLLEAKKAVRMQNYELAAKLYGEVATLGNSEAQYQLASLYLNGRGVPQEDDTAQALLGQAAAAEHPGAIYLLATREMAGNPLRGMLLMKQAASLGNPAAERYLARNAGETAVAIQSTDTKDPQRLHQLWFGYAKNNDLAGMKALYAFHKDINLRDASNRSALFTAIESGQHEIVNWLLEQHADPDSADVFGNRPLFLAVASADLANVQALLDAGADINATLPNMNSLLHHALLLDQQEIVSLLINAGVPLDAVNENGWTVLDLATESNEKTVLAMLESNKAEHSQKWLARQNYSNAEKQITNIEAMDASQLDDLDDIARLVVSGKTEILRQVFKKNSAFASEHLTDGSTLLSIAVDHGHEQIVELLLAAKANPNAATRNGITPLHMAARKNQAAILHALLLSGGNPLLTDDSGQDAVEWAVRNQFPETVTQLLDYLSQSSKVASGDLPYPRYLVLAAKTNLVSVIDDLLSHSGERARLAGVDAQGRSALWYAAKNNNAALIVKLLKAGLPANQQDDLGQSPFYSAVESACLECLNAFSGYADLNLQSISGNTPLIQAAGGDNVEILSWLLANGAKIGMRNSRGDTALIAATEARHLDNVKLLIAAGAKVSRKNNLGYSALDIAENLDPAIAAELKAHSGFATLFK